MPVFLVTYTSARTGNDITHETEWVTPANHDRDRACAAFEAQFPTASVVCIKAVDPC